MTRESGRWNPANWSPQHIQRTRNHAVNAACSELTAMLGTYQGALARAELLRDLREQRSREELKRLGFRTLSDGTDLGPSPKPK